MPLELDGDKWRCYVGHEWYGKSTNVLKSTPWRLEQPEPWWRRWWRIKLAARWQWWRIIDCPNCDGSGTTTATYATDAGTEYDVFPCELCHGDRRRWRWMRVDWWGDLTALPRNEWSVSISMPIEHVSIEMEAVIMGCTPRQARWRRVRGRWRRRAETAAWWALRRVGRA